MFRDTPIGGRNRGLQAYSGRSANVPSQPLLRPGFGSSNVVRQEEIPTTPRQNSEDRQRTYRDTPIPESARQRLTGICK